ncbi:tRNA 2'-phosphotransferase, variant 2 [Stygiomarasmius scandens]|uniref:tRNA 2'-phosphotransferase, variant 2 n=1 Tax=Marasmiellus scandens TaxID=2682957 RepID=A0ABR1JSH8_9AGAR
MDMSELKTWCVVLFSTRQNTNSSQLENPKIKTQSLDLAGLQKIVQADAKKRYELKQEEEGVWWIKANQGHSLKTVKLDLKPILSIDDIPSKIAVHGTTKQAWELISTQGLSKMTRNHIHLAQGVAGDNVISGMRQSSTILIYIDIPLALSSGIKFYLSENGVILSEGDERGFIKPEFFERVERRKGEAVEGWVRPSLGS